MSPAEVILTFPAFAIHEAVEEYKTKYGEGGVHNLIRDHILKNFDAFELMMAPYAVGHLKMGFVLDEFGYKLSEDERFKLFLTNTLESKDLAKSEIPGLISFSEESKLAGKVKREIPILVIIGNPPYFNLETTDSNTKLYLKKHSNVYSGKSDILYFFYEKGIIILKSDGLLSFITSRYFLEATFAKDLRSFICNSGNIKEIYDFQDYSVFHGVGIHTVIFTFSKSNTTTKTRVIKHSKKNNILIN